MIIGSRGCVYRVAAGGGRGFYRLSPDLGNGLGDYPILINGVSGTRQDSLGLFPCLENFKVIYTFGQGFGNMSVSGVVFLGGSDELNVSQSMLQLQRYFDANRTSKSKQPITVSMGSLRIAQRMYLNQLVLGAPDVEYNLQPFELRGILVEQV